MPSFLFLFMDRFLAHFVDLHFFHSCSYMLDISERNTLKVSKSLQQPQNGHPCTELCCHLEPHYIKGTLQGCRNLAGLCRNKLCIAISVLCDWDVLNEQIPMSHGTGTVLWHCPLAFPSGRKADGT